MDTETDPDYIEWLSTIEAHCNCCRICQFDIPCGGVQQGGFCDQMCVCSDDCWDTDDCWDDWED